MSKTPDWLAEEPLRTVLNATADAGGEARVVGGAVRDFLLGIEGGDVDVASTLLPEQTIAIAAQHNWKAIPTGIAHGTVTLVLPNRVVEVTTLRRDVTTDGRRATVEFTEDWRDDASRRDFTINALSMDAAGKIYDYFGGKKDIAAKRVVFIGDATTRITEDGLRILRFFRFLAGLGKPPADTAALAAITQKRDMIVQLSGERVGSEMKKLLSAHNPAYAMRLVQSTGVAVLVFGRDIEPKGMIRLQMLEGQADYQTSVWARALALTMRSPAPSPHPEFALKQIQTSPEGEVRSGAAMPNTTASELAVNDATSATSPSREVGAHLGATGLPSKALAKDGEGIQTAQWIANRWKLSRHEAQQLTLLASLPAFDAAAARHTHTRVIRLHGAPVYLDWLLVQAATAPGVNIAPYVQLAHDFRTPVFPISAKDLMAQGMSEGKLLGEALVALEQRWEESDYTLTKQALLE